MYHVTLMMALLCQHVTLLIRQIACLSSSLCAHSVTSMCVHNRGCTCEAQLFWLSCWHGFRVTVMSIFSVFHGFQGLLRYSFGINMWSIRNPCGFRLAPLGSMKGAAFACLSVCKASVSWFWRNPSPNYKTHKFLHDMTFLKCREFQGHKRR